MPDASSILVVGDAAETLDFFGEMLRRAGFSVRTVLSVAAVPHALEEFLPDLVLLDVRASACAGEAICRKLKECPAVQDIPVVFISASHARSDRYAAFESGAVDYVSEPFCEDEILGRVRTHAHLYRIRRNLEDRVARRTRELADSEAHLRQLLSFLEHVREEDRSHFARELHDELGQNLTALRIDFTALGHALKDAAPAVHARLQAIDQMLNGTVDSVRRICEDLRPRMLDDLGLEAALESYAKRFSRQYGVHCDLALMCDDFGLDGPTSTAVFRIVQESLTNIAKHAQAAHAMVTLESCGNDLLLSIADDGCGLPAHLDGERKTHGMLGMHERVGMLGGSIAIDSAPGRGTHIEVRIPRNPGASA